MQQLAPDVYRLGSKFHNHYVVTQGGKATIVDAGLSREWTGLVSGLRSIGLQPSDVAAIVITHGHVDHLGGARAAQDDGVRIEVHEAEVARALRTYQGREMVRLTAVPWWRLGAWRFVIAMMRGGGLRHPALDSVETFEDGDVLDLPGKPRVIHTPGHTEGHSCFAFGEHRLLFVGDALATQDFLGNRRGPLILPPMVHNDPEQARRSAALLSGVAADLVLPGHGEPFRGSPAEMVELALRS